VNREEQSSRGVPLVVQAVALTFASGATDITSFTRLGEVFSSVMTGNLVLLGLAVERASGDLAAHTLVAFVGYIAGVATGTLIVGSAQDQDSLWPGRVTTTLVVELVVFAGFAVGWEIAGSHPGGAPQLLLLAAASLAMGLQSAAVRSIGTRVATTYLTGTLTGVVASLVNRGPHIRENRMNLAVLGAAAAGAAAGGGLIAAAPGALPVLQIGALFGVIIVAIRFGVAE
jgi:uncharacterized membrane protein YoaK (UPF0700 family)